MNWGKAGAHCKEPVVVANQISHRNSPGVKLSAASSPCWPSNLTTGCTCAYCPSLALSIALYWCWIKLRAPIFYNFSVYGLSLQLGRFFFFSFHSFFASSKHKLAKRKESLRFLLLSERTQKVRRQRLWMQEPQVYGQPPVSHQLTCSAIQVNEVLIFHCFLSSLGWLWLRRSLWRCGEETLTAGYVIAEAHCSLVFGVSSFMLSAHPLHFLLGVGFKPGAFCMQSPWPVSRASRHRFYGCS